MEDGVEVCAADVEFFCETVLVSLFVVEVLRIETCKVWASNHSMLQHGGVRRPKIALVHNLLQEDEPALT